MIAIVDYGAGNLKNVKHALDTLGYESFITDRPDDLQRSKGLILPGVGAFGEAMKRLREKSLDKAILAEVKAGKPLLGICLGMQLLFDVSYEHGQHEGLKLIPGEIVPFKTHLNVPHMGWNQLVKSKHYETHPINEGIQSGDYVYFVHSYFAKVKDEQDILYTTDYGQPFTSAVMRDHIIGMQFHPEKSSKIGLKLLTNFGEMVMNENISSH